jgi:hypothetical protein
MEILKYLIDKVFSSLETSYVYKDSEKQVSERKEYLMKEVEIIQSIIKRMASNSFLIKGWTVALVVAVLLLDGNKFHAIIAYIPLTMFWALDAFFLWQEKMYRKLYEWVIKNRLKTDDYLLDLNAYRFRSEVPSRFKIMFSGTLLLFYGSITISIPLCIFILGTSTGTSPLTSFNSTLMAAISNISQ